MTTMLTPCWAFHASCLSVLTNYPVYFGQDNNWFFFCCEESLDGLVRLPASCRSKHQTCISAVRQILDWYLHQLFNMTSPLAAEPGFVQQFVLALYSSEFNTDKSLHLLIKRGGWVLTESLWFYPWEFKSGSPYLHNHCYWLWSLFFFHFCFLMFRWEFMKNKHFVQNFDNAFLLGGNGVWKFKFL